MPVTVSSTWKRRCRGVRMDEIQIGSVVRYKGGNPLILQGRAGMVFNIDQEGVTVLWRSHVLQPYESLMTVPAKDLSLETISLPALVAEVPPPQVQAPVIQTAPSNIQAPFNTQGHPYRGGPNPQLYCPPFPHRLLYHIGWVGAVSFTALGVLQVLLTGAGWQIPFIMLGAWVLVWSLMTPALWVWWQLRKW